MDKTTKLIVIFTRHKLYQIQRGKFECEVGFCLCCIWTRKGKFVEPQARDLQVQGSNLNSGSNFSLVIWNCNLFSYETCLTLPVKSIAMVQWSCVPPMMYSKKEYTFLNSYLTRIISPEFLYVDFLCNKFENSMQQMFSYQKPKVKKKRKKITKMKEEQWN